MASYTDITNTLAFAVSFSPLTAFPLDSRSMFGSLAAAEAAAAQAENAGSSNTVYYFGQTLTVFENDVATQYIIQGDKTLSEVGKSTIGDDKTIVLDEATGTLSMKSFGVEYYAYKNADIVIDNTNGTYTIDNMPVASSHPDQYVSIGDAWYKSNGTEWVVADSDPKTDAYYQLTTGWKAGLSPRVVTSLSRSGYEIAWYEPSATTVEGLQSAVATVQTEIESLSKAVDDNKTAAATDLNAEVERATGAESDLSGRITANKTAIDKLNGAVTDEGSVAKQVSDAVAAIVADAPEAYDTLVEISNWISTHAESAAAMNTSILNNAQAIKALEGLVGTLPEGTTASTVIQYIGEAIKAEADRALAAENALGIRLGEAERVIDGLGTAATANVDAFATAEQGAKADTAVQSIAKGTNGVISVIDGATEAVDVVVYEAPIASVATVGDVKVDGSSITIVSDGTISVQAVEMAKVTGLSTALTDATADANTYTDETAVAKTDVVKSADVATTLEAASDDKVISEKALLESLTWKTEM